MCPTSAHLAHTPRCGHCKKFKDGYEKAAKNLDGIVKFGAVNADTAKKTMQANGVSGYPTVKLYVPGTGQKNPYTGKWFKPAVDYTGPRSARGVVDFATTKLPSNVVAVSDAGLKKFKGGDALPKALLFTKKTETTPLLKALSVALSGRMVLGEARDTATKAVEEFGISDFPTLVVLPSGEGASPIKYEGELKPAALTAFLASQAAPPAAASSGDSSGDDDSLAVEVCALSVRSRHKGSGGEAGGWDTGSVLWDGVVGEGGRAGGGRWQGAGAGMRSAGQLWPRGDGWRHRTRVTPPRLRGMGSIDACARAALARARSRLAPRPARSRAHLPRLASSVSPSSGLRRPPRAFVDRRRPSSTVVAAGQRG